VDARLRCGRLAATSTTSPDDRSDRKASERIGCARRPGDLHGDGNKYN
jgi:hypothetical protein